MKFAVTIGAYRLHDFVELNVVQCRKVFPGSPILISDDKSEQSMLIESIAAKHGCAYLCSDKTRGHFAGDLQSLINSIVFAKSQGCDAVVKISQRLILTDPALVNDFQAYIDRDIWICAPKKLPMHQVISKQARFFAMLGVLSDFVLMRADKIDPQELIERYRFKVATEKVKHASFIEALILDRIVQLGVHGAFMEELSSHNPGVPNRYLRRAQNHRQNFIDLARTLGLEGEYNVSEWVQILGAGYRARPVVI